jgi:hypothetical protein
MKIAKQHGLGKARVALARKLASVLWRDGWRHAFGEQREDGCIDCVGFGEVPARLGEEPGAQRVDQRDGDPGVMQLAMEGTMVFGRWLHRHQRDLILAQAAQQGAATGLVIIHAEPLAGGAKADIKMGFTHIDTDINCRYRLFGQDLALHTGLTSLSSVQANQAGWADQARLRFQPRD